MRNFLKLSAQFIATHSHIRSLTTLHEDVPMTTEWRTIEQWILYDDDVGGSERHRMFSNLRREHWHNSNDVTVATTQRPANNNERQQHRWANNCSQTSRQDTHAKLLLSFSISVLRWNDSIGHTNVYVHTPFKPQHIPWYVYTYMYVDIVKSTDVLAT